MPTIVTEDATLHVEIDGAGAPVTVVAHGLTNSCNELAAFTPLVPGTKVRFDFRGHGLSSTPDTGYRFADFARDLDAVATAHGATAAVGTSLGAGAIMRLVAGQPDRFERIVLLLPAGLDRPRDIDLAMWSDLNPVGVTPAIREVVGDAPVADRELLRAVRASTLIVCREGDRLHPAEIGRDLAELMPSAEILVFDDEADMFARIPEALQRVASFLAGH